jgi:hypothetical protein
MMQFEEKNSEGRTLDLKGKNRAGRDRGDRRLQIGLYHQRFVIDLHANEE